YAVHYGAFASSSDAQTVLRQLGQARLVGYAEAFTLNGKPAHRVRLGPYATRAEAETVRLRAASLREDVSPRVVALDAEAAPAPAPSAAQTPAPAPAARPAATPPAPATAQRQEPPKPAAPAATPAPSPAPAAASGVGFVVQLGAFSSATDATALRDRLRAQG